MSKNGEGYTLDPVTFEVLKNAYVNIVDQMAEQIFRTCYSFVIWSRDFSSAICDTEGNTIMQGSGDIAAHVGTLHYTAQAVINKFGDDIHPGDTFVVNDVYQGGTHFNDTRIVRPIFYKGIHLGFSQANGHWADVGGAVPGSFNVSALDHMAEGLRITPVRVYSKGEYLSDVAELIANNTRAPADIIGDLQAQAEACNVAEREVGRLCDKYGVDVIQTSFAEVQDYVETLTRQRIAKLPDGVWETEDYIDVDPVAGEGLIPIRIKMTIDGDSVHYDLSGSHPKTISTFLNCCYGGAFAAIVAGTKMQSPDIPLNSGFYRVVTVDLGPKGTVVNADWPTPVAGFCSGPFEKIMNSVFELWAEILPERAMACTFNLEYLLIGGRDGRKEDRPYFMWYDWMVGGWGARNGRDGWGRHRPGLRRSARHAALRGAGTPRPGADHGPRAHRRFRRPRQLTRRPRRREGRDPDQGGALGRLLLLRPRALGDLGPLGRAAVDPARRLGQSGHARRALPGLDLLGRAGGSRRHRDAAVRRRRRPGRSPHPRCRNGVRGRGRRLCLHRAGEEGLRRRGPRDRCRPRGIRGGRGGD